MRTLRLALALLLSSAAAASAADLRAAVVVDGPLVTVGDLFDDAGALGETPLFRAPEFGVVGQLSAAAAVDAARALGLGAEANGLATVTVTRDGVEVPAAEIDALVREALAERLAVAPEDVLVRYREEPRPAFAASGALEPVRLGELAFAGNTGRFEAEVVIDRGDAPLRLSLAGEARATVEVVALARDVPRGTVLLPDDVTVARVEARRLAAGTVTALADVVGQEARRSLRAGQTLGAGDLAAATLVPRGSVVMLTYTRPGLSLSAVGEALADGALGDVVPVLNRQSRRIVEGVVTGGGVVEVADVPSRLASLQEPAR
jgi:flagella basal body P-ring formation protein FlgA